MTDGNRNRRFSGNRAIPNPRSRTWSAAKQPLGECVGNLLQSSGPLIHKRKRNNHSN